MKHLAVIATAGLALAGCGAGAQPTPRTERPLPTDATSCREYAGAPATDGSTYFEYKGMAINLPPGKSCAMPDGTVLGADQ